MSPKRLRSYAPPVKMVLLICIYAATTYSFMRSCMTDTDTPAVSGPLAFLVAVFWFPIMAIAIAADVAEGVKELLGGKD